MEKQTLRVEGMSCGHCKSSVEEGVGNLEGVSQVLVDLDDGLVTVEYDPAKSTLETIKQTIYEEGYDVVA
ncbi:copper chaperone CopZ [Thalassobacillus hwangdonensis]|uniref:Copper chaperone CopZ n=1 Tax=Thalassobacillus hwangdonensis TaxID=546108 RepID=A0ABW3L2K4_9BACI